MFVGCELGMTKQQAKDKYGVTASVMYYANGGDFGNGNTTREIWYKEGSRPLNIGVDVIPSGTPITLTYTGYAFKGWYHVETKEDGTPIADNKTGLCELNLEKPVDFKTAALAEDEVWYLGAYWEPIAKACVRLVSDIVITDKAGKTFDPTAEDYVKTSNYITTNNYQTELNLNKSPIDVAEDCDAQFVGYYYDQACTQPVMQELRYQDGQTEDAIVYVKYISKEWTVIRTADGKEDGAKKMFSGLKSSANKYYIARNIDMSGITNIANDANLAATVEGNGFTISNLTFFRSSAAGKYGLFSTVKSTANVKNLNFANVSFTYGLKADSEIYFVFEKMEEGATIENVTLSGTISIGGSANVTNMLNGYTNCLFGGFASDAEYLAAYPNGFKVLGNPEQFITKK